MNQEVKLGNYRHYKGHMYEVIGIANDSSTLEKVVVYRARYESPEFGKDALWTRTLTEFLGTVTIDSREVLRFEYVGNSGEQK